MERKWTAPEYTRKKEKETIKKIEKWTEYYSDKQNIWQSETDERKYCIGKYSLGNFT